MHPYSWGDLKNPVSCFPPGKLGAGTGLRRRVLTLSSFYPRACWELHVAAGNRTRLRPWNKRVSSWGPEASRRRCPGWSSSSTLATVTSPSSYPRGHKTAAALPTSWPSGGKEGRHQLSGKDFSRSPSLTPMCHWRCWAHTCREGWATGIFSPGP